MTEKIKTIAELIVAKVAILNLMAKNGGYEWSLLLREEQKQIEKTLEEIDELLSSLRNKS